MYRKIIVGYDGSSQAKDALALAKLLADVVHAELCLGAVFPLRLPLRGGLAPVLSEAERELEHELPEAASAVGATARPVQSGSPARGLYDLAEETGADLLVVGSSKRGRLGQTLLGNVAVALMHGSPCAVAVAPRGYAEHPDPRLSAIVVGYDGSPESQLALEQACELAPASAASLRLVSVAEPPMVSLAATSGGASYGWQTLQDAINAQARQQLEQGRSSVPDDIPVETTLMSGSAANALTEAARAPGSILLLGSRAYGPLRRVLLGSVSRELVSSAPCPLIVHPRGLHESPTTTRTAAEATTG
ncbi:MAG TPA: universal stress protein [Thermoleophilaceae bacterium]|nr:universal stress protein [Thermoleophilaceae bacterium]